MTTQQEQRTQPWKTQGCELCCGNSADQSKVWLLHKKHCHRNGKILITVVQSSRQTSRHQTKVLYHYSSKGERPFATYTALYNLWKSENKGISHVTNVLPFPQTSERTHLQLHANPTTSELTTTQPQLPSLVLWLQPQKPQPISTTPTLIIHGSWKSIHPQTVLSVWGVGLRFTRAHRCAQATDLLI